MTYPKSSGFQAGSETSAEAAAHIDASGVADGQMVAIESYLRETAKERGATADELRIFFQHVWPQMHNNDASSRLARLVNLGRACPAKAYRRASTGRRQTVYLHRDYADPSEIKPKKSSEKRDAEFMRLLRPALRIILERLDGGANSIAITNNGMFHNNLREYFKNEHENN